MSASLVGSEMCIRDRAETARRLRKWLPKGAHEATTDGATQLVLRVAPVSYTHLTLPTICSV
eukprot:4355268-Alexandrium_andersonii.AAC.1